MNFFDSNKQPLLEGLYACAYLIHAFSTGGQHEDKDERMVDNHIYDGDNLEQATCK